MKHTLPFIAAALSALLGVSAHAQTKIAIGYTGGSPWVGSFLAKDQGYFEKRGIDAEFTYVAVNPSIPPALVSGSLQIGTLGVPELLLAINGGIDMVVIAGAAFTKGNDFTGPDDTGVIGRIGASIKTPEDFIGKKVGVPGIGTPLDISFRKWLFDKGVALKTVTFVEVAFPQGGDALKGGLVDAYVAVDPFFNRILSTDAGYLIADYSRQSVSRAATVYATTREWATQHTEALKEFRQAIVEADAYAEQNPELARATIAKWLKLPPAAQAGIILPRLHPTVTGADFKFWADALIEQGLIKTSPDLSKLTMQ